ncbi:MULTISPECIES: glycosyltransferase [Flavobacterium]|uniref:glycosyltransferase n=1 Tax=Flavobacterium TaxID=237 RepID=UPI00086C4BE2|nr:MULTISPECIES: glycosyltransferase [Flavobacterium]MBN9282967.1 glycosyltransferase [Flavobacterium sp.]ODS83478.1 MAG: glycosyl transferase family 2 [Chryseobacterium sp. SCN 40-13]OJV67601.1 MAG: glycosyl transferase family 2 [Flavobacterium sp. 40-81]
MYFSFIIPVYNRPDEIEELLKSLTEQNYREDFEVVVVEDGSTIPCEHIVNAYKGKLFLSYYNKPNSGPGDSRNYGMRKAIGQYFIILDSDCILPENYVTSVAENLERNYVDCFGGPDNALDSFSDIQKAINFTMTSFLTTGGVRGGSEKIGKFQPRSFNMGLSKKAFEASGGFGNIHPGEDPDLSIRLWEMGFQTKLFKDSYVYHKRRIDWSKFYKQVNKFGKARPILDSWYPKYRKITFWFPSLFCLGFLVALGLYAFGIPVLFQFYVLYIAILFLSGIIENASLKIGFLSVIAFFIQFYGYGMGYFKSFFKVILLKQQPEKAFPELFFKK